MIYHLLRATRATGPDTKVIETVLVSSAHYAETMKIGGHVRNYFRGEPPDAELVGEVEFKGTAEVLPLLGDWYCNSWG